MSGFQSTRGGCALRPWPIAHVIIRRNFLIHRFVKEWTVGFISTEIALRYYAPETVSKITGFLLKRSTGSQESLGEPDLPGDSG